MKDLTYDDRIEIAYQEGRTAALSGSDVSRFTPGTPMHDSWLEGRTEGLQDRGWQPIGTVMRQVVRRLMVDHGD
jgi:ribosome modulation factor